MRLTCSGKYFDFRLLFNFFIENQTIISVHLDGYKKLCN